MNPVLVNLLPHKIISLLIIPLSNILVANMSPYLLQSCCSYTSSSHFPTTSFSKQKTTNTRSVSIDGNDKKFLLVILDEVETIIQQVNADSEPKSFQ
jgi:hypothetical protein